MTTHKKLWLLASWFRIASGILVGSSSQALAETPAFNINHAFIANEQAAGTQTNSFPGPLGGTISVGYTLDPATPTKWSSAGLVRTDRFNGHANAGGWYYPNGIFVPCIFVNTSAAANDVGLPAKLGAGQIHLHPGNPGADGLGQPASWAVLRYTVGSSGIYVVSGEFQSLNTGRVSVNVFHNGVSILSSGANSDETKFEEVVNLAAGDLVDFGVGSTGSVICASTGLYANIAPAPPTAEIVVAEPPEPTIVNGTGSRNFGTVAVGADKPVVKTFTIKNRGTPALAGLTITKDGPDAADFTVTDISPPPTAAAQGGTTTFKVSFAPLSTGPRRAAIHITSNKNPFQITVGGYGAKRLSPEMEAGREYDTLRTNLRRPLGGNVCAAFDEKTRAKQTYEPQALFLDTDRDPLDIILRRTMALQKDLASSSSAYAPALGLLAKEAAEIPVADQLARHAFFMRVAALRRKIAFSNPLLKPITQLLFITREALLPGSQHMCAQCYGFSATGGGKVKGNGLFSLENLFTDAPVRHDLTANSLIQNGRMKGEKLSSDGGFFRPDVSYDGKRIVFSYTDGVPDYWKFNEKTTFHIFSVNADGTDLRMLTDGIVNDLFPCWLPNGRIVFISERRGGYGRCHPVGMPSFTLHSMYDDGSDITCLSPHETNEWFPSVDNAGMVVYTRWDYVDRGFNQAHHPWITYPDGRDARAINGNTHTSERTAPHQIMNVRAIPGSPCYMGIASGHHTETRGSVVIVDPRIPDDNEMSQVRRLTPDQLFPEAEFDPLGASGAYASPWPLAEKYFLCVYDSNANAQYGPVDLPARNYAIVLADAFGNREVIYRDPTISCLDPMPLTACNKPPVIPHATLVGLPPNEDGSKPDPTPKDKLPKTARIGLVNVYNSRRPFPEGARITQLRIWQVVPKTTPIHVIPVIGLGDQKSAKICLGTVPVEADGSAYFEAPVNVPILFHAVGEDGAAVQGMRSVAYVAPGEELMCAGCHDERVNTLKQRTGTPLAMKREPSIIKPAMDGTNPFSYPRLVQPVLNKHCVACHTEKRAQPAPGKPVPPDLAAGDYMKDPARFYTSVRSLRPHVMFYSDAVWTPPYTIPGQFGAYASGLWRMLKQGHHDVKLSPGELEAFAIWIDSNCIFFGSDNEIDRQAAGEIVHPSLR
ncbi:MAG: choice-of-anchor D domain-containing protein [Verrucomicrobia bacterium]|nr:choice-of-anchor D domain-containing protein [Verrucomicrobiota bacterium]